MRDAELFVLSVKLAGALVWLRDGTSAPVWAQSHAREMARFFRRVLSNRTTADALVIGFRPLFYQEVVMSEASWKKAGIRPEEMECFVRGLPAILDGRRSHVARRRLVVRLVQRLRDAVLLAYDQSEGCQCLAR